jgi:hypothetical protein
MKTIAKTPANSFLRQIIFNEGVLRLSNHFSSDKREGVRVSIS